MSDPLLKYLQWTFVFGQVYQPYTSIFSIFPFPPQHDVSQFPPLPSFFPLLHVLFKIEIPNSHKFCCSNPNFIYPQGCIVMPHLHVTVKHQNKICPFQIFVMSEPYFLTRIWPDYCHPTSPHRCQQLNAYRISPNFVLTHVQQIFIYAERSWVIFLCLTI